MFGCVDPFHCGRLHHGFSGLGARGADALKRLNHDSDQTLELPEVLDASTKRFQELNKDNDLTLARPRPTVWLPGQNGGYTTKIMTVRWSSMNG